MSETAKIKDTQTQLDVAASLKLWAGFASQWIGSVFDVCSKHFAPASFQNDLECSVLWKFNGSCHTTGESALILVMNGRLWDADVLVRSVVEGTLKFAFLTIGSPIERQQKLQEFSEDFSEIGRLKRHQRIRELLDILDNPDADEWRPYRDLILSEKELSGLQSKYTKKIRQSLEHKWSFGEISASLRKSGERGFEKFGFMMFPYGMSSHIAHQDIDGINMVYDRISRSEVRRNAVELVHGARLVNDVACMTWLRAKSLFRLVNEDSKILKDLWKGLHVIQLEMDEATRYFHDIEYGANALAK